MFQNINKELRNFSPVQEPKLSSSIDMSIYFITLYRKFDIIILVSKQSQTCIEFKHHFAILLIAYNN